MRRLHRIVAILFLLALAAAAAVPYAGAFTGPDLERAADAYGAALQKQHANAPGDIAGAMTLRQDAIAAENKPESVKSAEAVVGRALAGQLAANEPLGESWLALARAWHAHLPKAQEGLWAAYKATRTTPALQPGSRAEALELAASTLLDQLKDTKTDFDFRTETIRKIGVRLSDDSYDEARIELERRQSQLPSHVRELVDLRTREERERAIIVDRLMAAIQGIDRVYTDLGKAGRDASGKTADLQKALTTRVLEIRRVHADARRDRAQLCVEFNLPLRSEAAEFITVFQAPRSSSEQGMLGQPLVRDRTVNQTQLCVHGLAHGHNYHVALRKGLPAKVGATLGSDFDTRTHKAKSDGGESSEERSGNTYPGGVKVPDRVATAGFRSSAFILPREGGGVVPLMTVNLDEVDLDLVRLSDRTLYRRIALGQIGNFVDYREFYEIKRHFSDAYWSGLVKLDKKHNETVTTDIPVRRLLDERNRIAESLVGSALEEPHISSPATIDRLEGRFRIDRTLAEPGAAARRQPGFYAVVAKIPHASYDHVFGDKPDSAELDFETGTPTAVRRNQILKSRSYGESNDAEKLWNRGQGSCQDQITGRSVSCLVSVQWLVVSDIGLSYYMGPNELYVVARSLATGKPVHNAKIELVAANNTVLASDATDSSGVVRFRSGLTRGRDGNRLAAIMAYSEADFSFIDYKRDAFDLSEHGVAGRTPPKNYDVYIYTDRGIYRPEETINATVLVRDTEGSAPQRVPPITLRLRQSSGIVAAEHRLAPEIWKTGGSAQQITIPKTSALGMADIVAYLGETNQVIGQASVQIDHFRPDRARITLSEPRQWSVTTQPDRRVTLKGRGSANYLYGINLQGRQQTDAPGAGLTGELSVLFQRAQSPVPGCYPGFRFEPVEEDFTPRLHRVTLPAKSDANGQIAIDTTAQLPPGNSPLEAEVALTVFDEAGKVGVQSLVLPMPVERPWLGVRHEARLIAGREGTFRMVFDLMAIAPGNQARAAAVSYKLFRERNAFVWHQQSNSWKYQQSVERVLAHEGAMRTTAGQRGSNPCAEPNGRIEHELPLGRYLLELSDDAGSRITYRLDSGWSSTDVRAPTPDRLTIHADAPHGQSDRIPTYKPGDTATFSVEAPFDGEVLLAIANEKVHLWDSTATTTDRRATVKLRIDPQWAGKSFYALATVFRRNTDGTTQRGPARAIGALYFNVDLEANRQVKVEIQPKGSSGDVAGMAMELSPSRPVSLKLKANIEGRAWATVYAVDEGLLSLTRHGDPDPYRRIFGQRALPMSLLDNYGRILLAEGVRRDKPGGDRSRRLLLSNYTSDRIVARFLGPVEFVNGEADVTFTEPFDFNGELRLTAIVWTGEKVGAASRPVTMRQRIVSELRMPRTMAAGDTVNATISLHNVASEPGRYRVGLVPRGPVRVTGLELTQPGAPPLRGASSLEVDLPDMASRTITATLVADATVPAANAMTALASIELKVEGASQAVAATDPIQRRFEVAVRPALQPATEIALVKLAPGENLKLDRATADRLTGARFAGGQLTVRAHAGTDLAAVLRDYGPRSQEIEVGSLERQIWRGYALLHGRAPAGQKTTLAEVVRGVEALQTRNDFFSLYRLVNESGLGESDLIGDRTGRGLARIEQSEIWRTALAIDFLMQARAGGQPITQPAFQRGVRALQAAVKSALRDAQSRDGVDPETKNDPVRIPTSSEARLQMIADKDDPREALQRPRTAAPPRSLAPQTSPADALDRSDEEPEKNPNIDPEYANTGQSADSDKADAYEFDDEIVDRSGPEFRACREDYLYATLVLARTDGIDRADLLQLMRRCAKTRFRPIGSAILAAAMHRFGLQQEARVVLAGIDPAFGATGRTESSDPDGRFDAMMLAFLSLAEAPESIRSELQTRIAGRHSATAAPLSVAAQVWLMRSYASQTAAPRPVSSGPLKVSHTGSLPIASTASGEFVSEFVPIDRLGGDGATLKNDGSLPAYVALLFRGVPAGDPAQAPVPGFIVERRILDRQGQDVVANNLPVRPGEMLYVLITGERDPQGSTDKSRLSDPVLVMDGTSSAFEIVDKDIFELARRAGVAVRALLPSEGRVGRLRMVEARDDGLLAVIRPSTEGKFSLGYTVRVIAPGKFVLPGTLVEDLRHTEISVQTPRRDLAIAAGGAP